MLRLQRCNYVKLSISAIVFLFAIDRVAAVQVEQRPKLEIQSGNLDVDHGSIYYEQAGSGPTIVFVHGGFGDRRMWDDQFAEFAKDFHVVRYDHRGFGKSPPAEKSYSPVDDLVRLLDHLMIDKVNLVGNSMGGSLVIDFALVRPERLESIVVVASGAHGFDVPAAERESVVAVFSAAGSEGLDVGVEKWLAHPMVAISSKDEHTATRLRTMVSENKKLFQIEYWPNENLKPAAADRLEQIQTRAFIIVGDKDTAFVRNAADLTAQKIPNAKMLILGGTDHLPHMLKPEEFNKALREWLK